MWLTDLRLLLPDTILERGAVCIEDGKIVELVEGSAPERGLSLPGLLAVPGLIDLHGDMLERDIEPRPRARFPIDLALFELDKRMAATGITTAYAAVAFAWNSQDIRRQETAEAIIRRVHELRASLLVDFRIHGRFEMVNPAAVPTVTRLLEERLIELISLMDHTPGQGQYAGMGSFIKFLDEWLGLKEKAMGLELHALIDQRMQDVRGSERDWSLVRDVVRAAREHGITIASHDDDTADKVRDQAEMGVRISEFPVTLEAAQAAHEHGMWVIMGAPNAYRGESNTSNLSARDALQAGLVDILASDYFPASCFQVAFRLAQEGLLPLTESIKLVSQNPADAMGLHDRGRIAVGCAADLVIVQEDVQPRVRATFRGGVPVYWDGYMAALAEAQPIGLATGANAA